VAKTSPVGYSPVIVTKIKGIGIVESRVRVGVRPNKGQRSYSHDRVSILHPPQKAQRGPPALCAGVGVHEDHFSELLEMLLQLLVPLLVL